VKFQGGYPNRNEIVGAVEDLWKTYHLEGKTKFNVKVERVWQESDSKWFVNSEEYGKFDGVIAAIGYGHSSSNMFLDSPVFIYNRTCGDPKTPHMSGQASFEGTICHSSELSQVDGKDKKIVVIGGGASAVEVLEFACAVKAAKTTILARVGTPLNSCNLNAQEHFLSLTNGLFLEMPSLTCFLP
jgi:cation diffusion facilitator CzcD-associated flavoprotein CzcO